MNTQEHIMVVGSEEAGEVAVAALDLQKALCKMLRFSPKDIHPARQISAAAVVVAEMNDLIASLEMLQETGLELPGLYDRAAIDAKKARVRKFMKHAIEQGSLQKPSAIRRLVNWFAH